MQIIIIICIRETLCDMYITCKESYVAVLDNPLIPGLKQFTAAVIFFHFNTREKCFLVLGGTPQ